MLLGKEEMYRLFLHVSGLDFCFDEVIYCCDSCFESVSCSSYSLIHGSAKGLLKEFFSYRTLCSDPVWASMGIVGKNSVYASKSDLLNGIEG